MGANDQGVRELNRATETAIALAAGRELERHATTAKKADVLHGAPYVILRDADGSERVEYIKEQFTAPTFRRGTVHLDDSASFIAYVNHHGTTSSAIYAQQIPAKFVAVLDEHPPTAAQRADSPSWREFRAEYKPAYSSEWDTWKGQNGKHFESTEAFAYFLENNLPDVADGKGAELLEVALNFRVNQGVAFSAANRLSDGHAELMFQATVEGSAQTRAGKVKIPETFTIDVPVFAGINCPRYRVETRLRYRLAPQGGLKLWYELVRPHKTEELAFHELWTGIGDGTKRAILLGKPD